jgi:hypothetical protein
MTPYELPISGGVVKLEWGTWAMHRYCEMTGDIPISIFTSIYNGEVFSFKHIITMVQAASESAGQVIDDRTAARYIDEAGGVNGKAVNEFILYTIKCMTPDVPTDESPQEEKKS